MSWIKGSIPFSWNAKNGPCSISMSFMLDDGTPLYGQEGIVDCSMMSYGSIVALYDQNMTKLLGFQTPNFREQWSGYIMLNTGPPAAPGATQNIAVRLVDWVNGGTMAGSTNPCDWTPLGSAPPEPIPPQPIPPQPQPPGAKPVTIVLDGKTYVGSVTQQ